MPLPLPSSLTPSKVAAFKDCALAFRFSVIDGLPEPPSAPAVKGTLVHRALELLSVLGAGFGFRTIAREMLDLVPVAGWAIKSGVAYSATKALGKAADEYFARGAVADASRLRALALGLRVEVEALLRRR